MNEILPGDVCVQVMGKNPVLFDNWIRWLSEGNLDPHNTPIMNDKSNAKDLLRQNMVLFDMSDSNLDMEQTKKINRMKLKVYKREHLM